MSEASCPNFEPRAHARPTGLTIGLRPTVIASRAPHLLLEQSVMRMKNRGRASPVNINVEPMLMLRSPPFARAGKRPRPKGTLYVVHCTPRGPSRDFKLFASNEGLDSNNVRRGHNKITVLLLAAPTCIISNMA